MRGPRAMRVEEAVVRAPEALRGLLRDLLNTALDAGFTVEASQVGSRDRDVHLTIENEGTGIEARPEEVTRDWIDHLRKLIEERSRAASEGRRGAS